MINVTVRRDGSSRFAKGHRFGTFPSVSAGWNISNENFMESTRTWLDFLKIRGSWGRVGNQNIDNYQYLAPIKNQNTHYYFGQYLGPNGQLVDYATVLANNWGAYPSRLGNLGVTWETSEQIDFGFDARLFNSRLGINFDWYQKTNKDWLVVAPILATAGTDAPFINGGDVKNTGIELGLTWNDVIGRDFSYSVSVNGAYNKNKVGSIPNEDGIIMVTPISSTTTHWNSTALRTVCLSVTSGATRQQVSSRTSSRLTTGLPPATVCFRVMCSPAT